MKFFRVDPGFYTTNYSRYRQYTRRDFLRVCAYCFVHEDDNGGEEAYQQDHFEPQSRPGVDPGEYKNLYWACSVCNSASCKHNRWPTPQEERYGKVFCDPCKCNPFSRDYWQDNSGLLVPLTPAGEFTIETLRLNGRPFLVAQRQQSRNLRNSYLAELSRLRKIEDHLNTLVAGGAEPEAIRMLAQVSRIAEKYEAIAYSKPFAIIPNATLPVIPSEILTYAQNLGS